MNKKVLLVEDDTLLSDSLAGHLREAGFEVMTAKDAEEASAIFGSNRPDIIVTDLTLPGVDGLTFAAAVAKDPKTENIPIIVLTNNDAGEFLAEAMSSGVTTYLLKADHSLASIVEEVKAKLGEK